MTGAMQSNRTGRRPAISRGHKITLIVFIVVILIPSGYKFIEKLYLFVKAARAESLNEGTFALVPVLNYFLVFFGMLCLLGWAISHGMFRNIEGPKYTMLETERKLDEQAGVYWDDE